MGSRAGMLSWRLLRRFSSSTTIPASPALLPPSPHLPIQPQDPPQQDASALSFASNEEASALFDAVSEDHLWAPIHVLDPEYRSCVLGNTPPLTFRVTPPHPASVKSHHPVSEMAQVSKDLNAFFGTMGPRNYDFYTSKDADFCKVWMESFVPPAMQSPMRVPGIIGAEDLIIKADSVKRKRKKKMNKHKHRKLRRRVRKSGK